MTPASAWPTMRWSSGSCGRATFEPAFDEAESVSDASLPSASLTASNRLQSVVGAALIVMSGVAASKGLGLLRNVVISHQYGATREYESFLAAISIPDTVFQVLAGGAVSAAFIPVFTQYLSESDERRAWRLTSSLINIAVLGVGAVALLLALAAPLVMPLLLPGWTAAE